MEGDERGRWSKRGEQGEAFLSSPAGRRRRPGMRTWWHGGGGQADGEGALSFAEWQGGLESPPRGDDARFIALP